MISIQETFSLSAIELKWLTVLSAIVMVRCIPSSCAYFAL